MLTTEQREAETQRKEKVFQEYLLSADYQKKLKLRAEINDACGRSAKARVATWQLCERPDNTVEGIKFFLNNFCYTLSTKTDPKHLPFILFEFQEDAIRWIVDRIEGKEDGLIEKSREMGMSWLMFVAVPIYYWLFRDGINILVGSYKEMLVDDRGIDSLFGKMDYLLQGLPKWLLPKRFKSDKHRKKMQLTNPANNNLITGDTMNPNFGRGARKTLVMYDELGFWDYAKDAWEGASDTTDCRICNSTPCGYNYYAQLRESEMPVLSLLWKLHPLKDQAWYDYQKLRRTEEELAQEVDISYSKSREGRVYPEWNETNVERGLFEYDDNAPLFVSQDFGKCMSEDTEALTKEGWKTYDKLNVGDLIYTLNQETLKGEWQPINGIYVKDYDGKLKMFNSPKMKAMFEPDHKWYTQKWYGKDRKIVPGSFKSSDEFKTTDILPVAAVSGELPKNKTYDNSLVKLLAWSWTEGHIGLSGAIEIGQAIPENIPTIRKVLEDEFGKPKKSLLGVKESAWTERKPRWRKNTNYPITIFYINKPGAKRIRDLFNEDKVIKYDVINKFTKKQLESFMHHSMMADGCNSLLKQSNLKRTEVFGYVLSLLGYRTSFGTEKMKGYSDCHYVRYSTKDKLYLGNYIKTKNHIVDVDYNGKIWCPSIDNHVWLARNRGKTYFTGNSDDNAIIWAQPTKDGKLRIIDTYRNTGKNIDFYVPFITGYFPGDSNYNYTADELNIIEDHRNWKRATHFGDPAGRFHNQVSDESVIDVLRKYGVVVNFKDKWKEFKIRKSTTKRLIMDGIELNSNVRNKYFDICIINSSYPKVKSEGMAQVRSEKPLHNSYSHYRSALEYLALGLSDMDNRKHTPIDKFKPRSSGRIAGGY